MKGGTLLTILLWGPISIWAQCCSPGNPIGGAVNPGVSQQDIWQVFAGYRYGLAGEYFEGNQPVQSGFVTSGSYQHLGLALTYGLTEKVTLEAETGYFLQKSQSYAPGIIPQTQTGSGLTDVSTIARVNLWNAPLRGIELTSGLGVKFPLGNSQQMVDGILLPRDLQPSTGSVDFIHTLFAQKTFLPQHFRLFLLSRFELKGQSPDQYRYGNFLAISGFASYSPTLRWTIVGQIRGEWRGRDTRPITGSGIPLDNGREIVPPTGSQKLFFSPQVGYEFSPRVQLSLLSDLPLYQQYFESQLGTTFSLWLNIRIILGKD